MFTHVAAVAMGSLEEELKSFVVDEEDVRVLRESGADYEATVVTASATGEGLM